MLQARTSVKQNEINISDRHVRFSVMLRLYHALAGIEQVKAQSYGCDLVISTTNNIQNNVQFMIDANCLLSDSACWTASARVSAAHVSGVAEHQVVVPLMSM
jgi:hypothetical protein